MERGWDASGLLQPAWKNYPGGRDALALAVGTSPSVLSSINTGKRNLGIALATRLAAKLGVSVLELGAPEGLADPRGKDLLSRLEALREEAEAGREGLALALEGIQMSLARIEARLPGEAGPARETGP